MKFSKEVQHTYLNRNQIQKPQSVMLAKSNVEEATGTITDHNLNSSQYGDYEIKCDSGMC